MSQLDSILSLHFKVSQLEDVQTRLAGVPEWMAELHEEYSVRKSEIDQEQSLVEEADRKRREAETEVQDAQEKLSKYQGQISQVTTQREYGALLKEIDTVKTQIKEAEDVAMAALEESETAGTKLEQLRTDFTDLDQRYQAELAKWEEEKPSVQKKAGELEAAVGELREKMPKPFLSLYDRIRKATSGQAVARVMRISVGRGSIMWHCSACHYNVRPQILVEIKGQELHQCESCKRILFWQEDPEEI